MRYIKESRIKEAIYKLAEEQGIFINMYDLMQELRIKGILDPNTYEMEKTIY